MKNIAAYVIGAELFVVANTILYFGRASIGTNTPLLAAVVGGNLLSIAVVAPATLANARSEVTAWYRAWKNGGAA